MMNDELTQSQEMIKNDLISFVKNWRTNNGILYDEALNQDDLIKATPHKALANK